MPKRKHRPRTAFPTIHTNVSEYVTALARVHLTSAAAKVADVTNRKTLLSAKSRLDRVRWLLADLAVVMNCKDYASTQVRFKRLERELEDLEVKFPGRSKPLVVPPPVDDSPPWDHDSEEWEEEDYDYHASSGRNPDRG